MKRLIARLLIYGLAALLLAGTGMLAWQLREQRLTFYTDADSIREPEQLVQVRDILWQRAQELGQSVNSLDAEHGPKVSGDETTLFFVRGRPSRNADIYYSFRTGRGWSDPQPLVEVNTEADELGPAPSFDGRSLYFHSDREGGSGGYDLWVVHREDDGWGEPINLGPEVNSRYNDYGAAVSPEGDTLYFASNRPSPYDLSRPPDDASPTVIAEDSRRAPTTSTSRRSPTRASVRRFRLRSSTRPSTRALRPSVPRVTSCTSARTIRAVKAASTSTDRDASAVTTSRRRTLARW